ncbi:MAG: ABC transporter substrate-binding protein [Treponemataceae bacterium]
MKKYLFFSILITIASLFISCEKKDVDTIKIGVFEPLTGANAGGGMLELEGIKLAHKLYPEVLGKKVELVIVDNKSDKAEATTAVARLIEKDKVSAILGSWGSGFSIAAGDLIKSNKVPAVALSATNPLVTLNNDYYFRVCFLDPFQGTIMANYAVKNLQAKNTVVIQEISNDYAVGLANFFKSAFVKLTGNNDAILETLNYQTNDQDFSGILGQIKSLNPDIIFAPGNFTESALIIRQAREMGIETPFVGGDTWETPEFIDVGRSAVEGVVLSTFFDDTNPITEEGKKFIEEYKNQYKKENIAAVTALGYDGYIVVLDAIKRAGSADPQAIQKEIAKTQNFEGVTGLISMNADGDVDKVEAIIKTVQDGKFVYMDTININ